MSIAYIVFLVFLLILGIIIGSFLNVCIFRIPKKISVAKGRSFCPSCKTPVKAYDNIPIISFFMLKGKCRKCKQPISPRYPIVEALCGAAFFLIAKKFFLSPETVILCVFASCLICIAFIDLDTCEIPDRFSVIILSLGILSMLFPSDIQIIERLIGLICISGPMLIIMLITGGFGMGDIKLMAAAGLLLGWKNILVAGILGAVIAAVVSVVLIALKKKTMKDKIAFGPYLSVGLFIGALYGADILFAYLGLFIR